MPREVDRPTAMAAVVTAVMLAGFAGCASGSVPGPARDPGSGAGTGAAAGRAEPGPARSTAPPPAPRRLPRTAAEFDLDPCALLTVEELRAALAEPYFVLSGQVLEPAGRPSVGAGGSPGERDGAGCGYSFVGAQTDTADVHHSVIVRVTRWATSGPRRMADCHTAAATAAASPPARYRPLALRDEACLGPAAVVPIRAGRVHYTVAVIATPPPADTRDEDVLLAPMVLAAAQLAADRLPAG